MEIGQFTLTGRNGKCFDLYLGWLTNTEVSDCDCPRAAAAALRETSSLRLTFFACPLEFTIPFSAGSAPTFPYADPKSRLSP